MRSVNGSWLSMSISAIELFQSIYFLAFALEMEKILRYKGNMSVRYDGKEFVEPRSDMIGNSKTQ